MYRHLIRPLLFLLPPEKAHRLTLSLLEFFGRFRFLRALTRLFFRRTPASVEKEVFGLRFPNPVGLAGGMDKNARCCNPLSDFGFGFVEIGSVTPLPQPGNPPPRLFRLPKDKALINRMGINSEGVMQVIANLKRHAPDVIIGANIAKNTATSGEQAAEDYDRAFSLLYDFADFFVFNISCPNVEGFAQLQDAGYISEIMDGILDKRMCMEEYKPLLLKISPDLGREQLDEIIAYCLRTGVDGLVATNTTAAREGLALSGNRAAAIGKGGLSGAPLLEKSLRTVRYIHEKAGGRLPIIGCGGIMSPEDAQRMLDAGASLVEICTGFVYEGPGLVKRILRRLAAAER